MTYIILAFYMFWAGAAGEYLSAKYPQSSVLWVLFWSFLWPVRISMMLIKINAGVR